MELQFFFKSLFAATFILITTFPSSRCKENENFSACTQPYECGDIKNLYFPFWGDGRPEICGHPGFNLSCMNNEYPVIHIQRLDYRLLNVSREINTMTLARLDLWDNPCSPDTSKNTTLDDIVAVNYPPTVVNLTLIYNCTKPEESLGQYFPNNFSCPKDDDRISYYVRNESQLQDLETEGLIRDRRGGVIQVPVFRIALDEIERSAADGVHSVLIKGFDVNYMEFPLCRECEWSSGRCGSNNSNGMVTCYCSGGREYLYVCPHSSGRDWKLKTGIGIGGGFVGILLMSIIFYIYQRRKRKQSAPRSLLSRDISSDISSVKDVEKGSSYHGVHLFTYEELVEATSCFDSTKELGDGGFGTVYYGKLRDGRVVAVKRLYENNFRRVEQFMNEVEILAHLRHKNLVSLYGCTSRHSHELLLVYEYIPNGTVADHLHGERAKPGALPWAIRLNIAVETASALKYLHASDVIHRDVKSTNILLDNNFSVKVADFGLSRLFPTHVTHVSTAPQGTPGYVDPEYHQCYQLTSKSDVFSFGVVLMELVSSLPAVDITRHRHDINLSTMAMNRILNHALHELVDPSLGFDTDPRVRKMITAVAELAFQCLQQDKDLRPCMVAVLDGLMAIQSGDYSTDNTERIDSAADETVLLKKGPLSPDSVAINWDSRITTPNASG
ncbi:LEAF RUST 10 DISEASE-RESISTANCE LOCUS RECEPTOR-LIKE PROTEIN KINASE-like 1.2 isoform X3 [Morus notabilis]|uniref:LEAF RUST 10 DISEASE-RESISTANCE LOCUS RECEPTOR-LIKE PROTEIN KINASE-like 1.2 isoform X3 n=1 Tax=Morus notabilis TaxID=981085 RepID=UPI000CED011E|nr:LEAF RUST 10 DISEASE-RESISTANCE LOCUS RECEPTOR-LIKE PROTEIN KINASE-like 1.2 isoform X3 [Morus notabilis]